MCIRDRLDPEQPGGKYVNSPETLVYKKSRTLFALNFAKKSQTRRYILCEGNLDAISMHQAGFTTAVAGCGTALTAEQVKILSEYADEVAVSYTHLDVYKRQAQHRAGKARIAGDARTFIAGVLHGAVSYTHLDVYKRQGGISFHRSSNGRRSSERRFFIPVSSSVCAI